MSDVTVNVTNAGSTGVTVANGSTFNATVSNGGSVTVATGTVSPGNATVVSGTVQVGKVTTLSAGSSATVSNAGTAYAASLDFGIPAGPATNVTVGSTTTLESGNASVTGTTSGNNLTLAFAIPRGAAGAAGSNGTNGTTPTITASATTLSAGSSATVTATPSNGGANVALAFGIPAGAAGSGGASLSDATPSALGTASAGTSSTASRSDHVHAVPVISYANLTNVPSSFAPSSHTHTLADLTQSSATTGQVPTWNGAAWAAATPSSGSGSFTLPTASSSVLGGIKVGSGLTITDGVLSRSSSYDPAAAPGAPSGIAFNTSTGSLTWNASPGGVATQYEVQRSAMGAGAWTTVATVSGLSFSITAISWSSIDKFRVRGLNADSLPGEWGYQEGATPGGGGGSASIVEAATAAGFPATGASGTLYHATDVRRIYFWDASGGVYVEAGTSGGGSGGGSGEDATLRALFIPAAPTSVTASAGNAQATVSWTAPAALSVLPITDYTIQFQPSGGSWTTFTRAASTATSATVTGLTNGTAYTFKVSATNGLGAGSYSSASSAVTPAAAAAIAYANKYGPGSYSVTGTGTVTASVTGGNNADTRLWLLIGTSGTLSYTVTASSENGYDGGALYRTSSSNIQPANHSTGLAYNSNPPGLVVVSDIVSGTGTSTGTVSVTAGQHLVLRYAKDDGGDAGTDSITAVLSIS